MSKVEKPKNPFAEFNLLTGGIVEPDNDDAVDNTDNSDEVIAGDPALIKDKGNKTDIDEKARLEAGDKALAEQLAKRKAIEEANKVNTDDSTADDPENDEDIADETKPSDNGYKTVISEFYNKGILDVNLEEIGDTEEDFDKAITSTVEKKVNKWVESLPEEYVKFLDFVQAGGKPKDFLDLYYGNHTWEGFKVESEEAQKLVARESLRLSGYTPEDIEEMVTEWFDNGTLEKRAKSGLIKLQKNETVQKEQLLKKQEEAEQNKIKENREFWDNFKKELYAKSEIMGFPVNDKTKDRLWEFMTVPDKKTGKTAYQEATEKQKDSALLFALQAMNNFDIKKLEKQVQTKVSNSMNALLKNYTKDSKAKISGGSTEDHSGSNPFEGFKSAKA